MVMEGKCEPARTRYRRLPIFFIFSFFLSKSTASSPRSCMPYFSAKCPISGVSRLPTLFGVGLRLVNFTSRDYIASLRSRLAWRRMNAFALRIDHFSQIDDQCLKDSIFSQALATAANTAGG